MSSGENDGYRRGNKSSERSHRKKHRHRRKSRSRSPRNIHVNPNFGSGSSHVMGPSASQLLETNNFLEAETARLRQENAMALARCHAVEAECRSLAGARGQLEQRVSQFLSEKRKMSDAINTGRNTISSLETTNFNLRKEVQMAKKERDDIIDELKRNEQKALADRAQVDYLTDRNVQLSNKCVELVDKVRSAHEEIDKKAKVELAIKCDVKRMQTDVELCKMENKRFAAELDSMREKERNWKMEKLEFERLLTAKDASLTNEKKKFAEALQAERDHIERLEKRLRTERPAYQTELATESVFRALELVKGECAEQLKRLFMQMDEIKEAQNSKVEAETEDEGLEEGEVESEPKPKEELPFYLRTQWPPVQMLSDDQRPGRCQSTPADFCPLSYLRNAFAGDVCSGSMGLELSSVSGLVAPAPGMLFPVDSANQGAEIVNVEVRDDDEGQMNGEALESCSNQVEEGDEYGEVFVRSADQDENDLQEAAQKMAKEEDVLLMCDDGSGANLPFDISVEEELLGP